MGIEDSAGKRGKNRSAAPRRPVPERRPAVEAKDGPAPRPAPGKRSGVEDAHDRYANIEISYLGKRR